jgi:hypothetical protein
LFALGALRVGASRLALGASLIALAGRCQVPVEIPGEAPERIEPRTRPSSVDTRSAGYLDMEFFGAPYWRNAALLL